MVHGINNLNDPEKTQEFRANFEKSFETELQDFEGTIRGPEAIKVVGECYMTS